MIAILPGELEMPARIVTLRRPLGPQLGHGGAVLGPRDAFAFGLLGLLDDVAALVPTPHQSIADLAAWTTGLASRWRSTSGDAAGSGGGPIATSCCATGG